MTEDTDIHPVNEAQEIERAIDEELPYPVVVNGETSPGKEVIDPTGEGWFCWESIKEIPF